MSNSKTIEQSKSRTDKLCGATYKIKVPNIQNEIINIYITINNHNNTNQPFEIFINGSDAVLYENLSLTMVLLSRLLRAGINPKEIITDLHSIHSATGGHFIPGGQGHSPSLASRIGDVLEEHIS